MQVTTVPGALEVQQVMQVMLETQVTLVSVVLEVMQAIQVQ
jgi:hypothetical protein